MAAEHLTHRWKRCLRFSLRRLICFVLVIGLWLGWTVRSARIQREAVAAIERTGSTIDQRPRRARAAVDPGLFELIRLIH